MSVGDVWSIKVLSEVLGVYCMNNFHFVIAAEDFPLVTPTFIRNNVADSCVTLMSYITSDSTAFVASKSYLEPSTTSPRHTPLVTNGSVSGDTQLVKLSWWFSLTTENRDYKNGYKHFSGVPSSWLLNGEADPANMSWFDIVANGLAFVVNYPPLGLILKPCVWSRPTTLNPLGAATPIKYAKFVGVSSQNSRTGRANAALLSQFA